MVLSKNVIKYFCLIITMGFFLTPLNIEAQKKKKKNKKNDTEAVVTPPKKAKEKSIKDLTKSSEKIDGLFTIYRDTITGSTQIVITEEQLNKEYIHFAQIADGVMDAGRINRGSYRGSKVFKVQKFYNKIEFVTQNTSFYFDPNNPISKSKDANISKGIMASVKIEARDDKAGLYLIKADGLFLKETFLQIKPSSRPGASPTAFKLGGLDKGKTKITSVKNYPENSDIKVEYVFSKPSTLNGGSDAVSDGRNVSV